jgi:DNA repair protein RecO (recombination protein O)
LLLYTGRSLDVITQAETLRPYGAPLAGDYPRYTTGTVMLEAADRFTPVEKEPALRQFLLLVGGLRALGEKLHDPRLVLDAFLLRSLAVAGYPPALDECAVCGTPDPAARADRDDDDQDDAVPDRPGQPGVSHDADAGAAGRHASRPDGSGAHLTGGPAAPRTRASGVRAFGIAAGGLVCRSCRPAGAATPAVATIGLMSALLRGDWARAEASEPRQQVECSSLVAAYAQWHLEHSIRSLRHVEHA